MNKYTKRSQFIEKAEDILNTSDLLIKSDCKIVDDVLYEKIDEEHKYRFFFSSDDYDYLEDEEMIARLDKLFA